MDTPNPLPSDEDIQVLEDMIQYHFSRRCLLREALSATGSQGHPKKNEVLATIGDAVLCLSGINTGHSTGFSGNPEGNEAVATVGDALLRLDRMKAGPKTGFSGHAEESEALPTIDKAFLRLRLMEPGHNKDQCSESIDAAIKTQASSDRLDRQGKYLEIDRFIMNRPSQGTNVDEKTRITAREAIVGAVFLDSGAVPQLCADVIVALGYLSPE